MKWHAKDRYFQYRQKKVINLPAAPALPATVYKCAGFHISLKRYIKPAHFLGIKLILFYKAAFLL